MEVIQLKNKIDLSEIENIENKPHEDNKSENNNKDIDDILITPDFYLPPPPPIILSPEEAKEKRKLIIHIKNFINTFPHELHEFKDINYSEKTINELKNYIEEIKLTVANTNNTDLYIGLFGGACDFLEKKGHYVGYDLKGLTHIATNNDNVIKCVKEIALEYQQLTYIKPEKRLLLIMLSLCYGVNYMNKNISNNTEKDINDLNKKYSDI